MNESEYEKLEQYCHNLKISVTTGEIAKLTEQLNMSTDDLSKLCAFFQNLDTRRKETVVSTCLNLSRLPLKEPKTFDNFDFSILHSKDILHSLVHRVLVKHIWQWHVEERAANWESKPIF